MKRGLVLIVCGLASTLLVSGCGGGGGGGGAREAVGREITDAFAGTPAQKKHLVCYVTIKELDGEMPRDPAELLADVAEYFGEEFVDQAAYLHYLAVTKRYLDEVETIEEHGIVSANTSLATVCNT